MNCKKVLYEELTPTEFKERLKDAPIAYLPLGTLEWHGEHLPLGADGIQSQLFFERMAGEVGGIVLPKLFLGPDMADLTGDSPLYGMDMYEFEGRDYQKGQLAGSAYWVDDSFYKAMMDNIAAQLSRAGFKILVAHGHGPSTRQYSEFMGEYKDRFGLDCFHCFIDDLEDDFDDKGFQVDHAAKNETSIVMALRPELVRMDLLDKDPDRFPVGVHGKDPRTHASANVGEAAMEYTLNYMKTVLTAALQRL